MKLADLHPEFQRVGDDPALFNLLFDCPRCGAPWRCVIKARLNGKPGPQGVWSWTAKFQPMIDWGSVTVSPSVRYEGEQAHGRKRLCNAHFTIANGEVSAA